MSEYLQSTEAEKQKLKAQTKRLFHENTWLREELANLQGLYRQSEVNNVSLEEENKQLKFTIEMSKYDAPDQSGLPAGEGGGRDDKNMNMDEKDDNDQDGMCFILTPIPRNQ